MSFQDNATEFSGKMLIGAHLFLLILSGCAANQRDNNAMRLAEKCSIPYDVALTMTQAPQGLDRDARECLAK